MLKGEKLKEGFSVPPMAPAYPAPPYRMWVDQLILMYRVKEDVLRNLIPTPLEPGDEPICRLECSNYWRVAGMGPFRELIFALSAKYKGKSIFYSPYMLLDSDIPTFIGREIWGSPKKIADEITFIEKHTVYTCRCKRGGIDLVTATMEETEYVKDPKELRKYIEVPEGVKNYPFNIPESLTIEWKKIPSSSKNKPPDVNRLVLEARKNIKVLWAIKGPAHLNLGRSASDPVYVFEPEEEATAIRFGAEWDADTVEDAIIHVFEEYRP